MEQHPNTHIQSLTTEELFQIFKHDSDKDFHQKLAAGIILHERNYNAKELIIEKDLIIESIKKGIEGFEDKTVLKSKMSIQNRKSIIATTSGSLIPVVIFIYLYLQLEDKNSNDAYFIIGGAFFLSAITIYNIYNYTKKLKKITLQAKEENTSQKQKLDLIAKEWTF